MKKVIFKTACISLAFLLVSPALKLLGVDSMTSIFALLSLVFFFTYLLGGVHNWGWLIPTMLFASLTALTASGHPGYPLIIFPFLFGLAIPFYVAYVLHPQQWKLLVPVWILLVLPVISPVSELINADLLAILFLYVMAVPFLCAYLLNRKQKWAYYCAIALGTIALLPIAGLLTRSRTQAFLAIFLISLPFFKTLVNKKNFWANNLSGAVLGVNILAFTDILPNQLQFIPHVGLSNELFAVILTPLPA